MVNKNEFIKKMAKNGGIRMSDAERSMNLFIDTMAGLLSDGKIVHLIGLGKFRIMETKERMGRNPSTKEPMKLPGFKTVKFKASKVLTDKCCK